MTVAASEPLIGSFRTRAVSSTFIHYATALLVSLLNSVTVIVLVRGLTVEEYGGYNVLVSLVAFGNLMTSFGINPIIQRFLPEYVASGGVRLAQKLIGGVVSLKLVSSLLFAAFLFMTSGVWLAWVHLPSSMATLLGITLLIFLVAVEGQLLGDGVLVSLLDHRYWGAARVGHAALKVALFAWVLKTGGGVGSVLVAWLATECLLLALYGLRVYASLFAVGRPEGTNVALPLGRLAKFGAYLYFHNVGFFLRDKTLDIFVIAYFLGSYEVGLYAVAFGVAALLLQFSPGLQLRAIMTTLLVERYVRDPSPEAIERSFAFFAKLVFFVGMPLFALPAVLSQEVIVYLLNPEYVAVSRMFAVALCLVGVQQMANAYGPALATLEKSAIVFGGNVFSLYNLIMDLLLIPPLGLWGAVLATGSGGIFLYLYYAVAAKRVCRLSQPWGAYRRASLNLALTCIVLYLLRPFVNGPAILIGILVFSLGLYLLLSSLNRIFTAEERVFMRGLIKRDVWIF